jgi:hypothetical protein
VSVGRRFVVIGGSAAFIAIVALACNSASTANPCSTDPIGSDGIYDGLGYQPGHFFPEGDAAAPSCGVCPGAFDAASMPFTTTVPSGDCYSEGYSCDVAAWDYQICAGTKHACSGNKYRCYCTSQQYWACVITERGTGVCAPCNEGGAAETDGAVDAD